jgi:PIN domain nuclease of toxin-antitoxin system
VKVKSGKMSLPLPAGDFLVSQLVASGVQILPITLDHVLRVESLEIHHRDPFDRILMAQSIEDDLPILTTDPFFKKYPVQIIW